MMAQYLLVVFDPFDLGPLDGHEVSAISYSVQTELAISNRSTVEVGL